MAKSSSRRTTGAPLRTLMALSLAAGLAPGLACAAPKLSVAQPRREIGALTAGQTAEAEFPIANMGDALLEITQVTVGCGCTTTSYPASLRPGETGVLKVKLVSSALWNGPVEKEVTLHSNDPEQPAQKLLLVAEMRPLLRFEPANPLAIEYKKGDVLRRVVTVTPAADAAVAVTGVVPAGPGTEARLLPAESGDRPGAVRVEITVRPPAQGGDFSTSVMLQTTHAAVPAVPLVVMAVSQDAITISPSFLYLGSLRAASRAEAARPSASRRAGTLAGGQERLLILFKRSGTFRVLGIRTDTPALQATLRPPARPDAAAAANYHEIAVRYVGGWPKGDVTGKLVVTTDDPQSPTIEVPFQARVE
jgi:hypothetical protein